MTDDLEYSNDMVRGIMNGYSHWNGHVGSQFHVRKMDFDMHFKTLPALLKQVLYLVGVTGQDHQTVGFLMDAPRTTVARWYEMGVAQLCNLMNGVSE